MLARQRLVKPCPDLDSDRMKIIKTAGLGLFLMASVVTANVEESALNVRVVWSQDPQSEAVVVWEGEVLDELVDVFPAPLVSHPGIVAGSH